MYDKKDSSKSPRDTNGPVVKTGPTAGKNRSRNDDGAWRKKRSDTGETRKKSGCFISTVACHYKGLSDDCHELRTLRHFRDWFLLNTSEGTSMVEHYYSIAPIISKSLLDSTELEQVWVIIQDCIGAIELKDYEKAKSLYVEMVISLEQKYIADRC